MNNEFENFVSERERNKSDHERWAHFEHTLRYLLCDLKDKIVEEDYFLTDDIKQAIIVFVMKDKFEESNDIFLCNMRNDFYIAIEKLEGRHTDIKGKTRIIKLFMEDFYFNKQKGGIKMIKDKLKEAKRYDEVVNILKNIISDNQSAYPVMAFVDNDGKTKWNVDGSLVKEEASRFLDVIENGETKQMSIDDFLYLTQVIHTETDMRLHNYAVAISHRGEPHIDMERIRIYEILENLLYNLDDIDKWTIPDGWKKIEKEEK